MGHTPAAFQGARLGSAARRRRVRRRGRRTIADPRPGLRDDPPTRPDARHRRRRSARARCAASPSEDVTRAASLRSVPRPAGRRLRFHHKASAAVRHGRSTPEAGERPQDHTTVARPKQPCGPMAPSVRTPEPSRLEGTTVQRPRRLATSTVSHCRPLEQFQARPGRARPRPTPPKPGRADETVRASMPGAGSGRSG